MKIRQESKVNLFAIIDNRPMFRIGVRKAIYSIAPKYHISDYGSFDDLGNENPQIRYTHFLIWVGSTPYNTIVNNIRRLRVLDRSCKIILYGYQESINHMILFLAENINAYLQDNFDEKELRECFCSLENNKLYLNNQITTKLLNIKTLPGIRKNTRLTPTEVKIADLLVRGMKTSLIAKEMDRKISTISTIKSNIFRKVNVDNIVDLAGVINNTSVRMKV